MIKRGPVKTRNEIVYDVDGVCYLEINSFKYGLFLCEIDESDISIINIYIWYISYESKRTPGRQFNVRANNRSDSNLPKTLFLGRYLSGYPANMVVDHINGHPTDNRRVNLRTTTTSGNMRNVKATKGIHWDIKREKWLAQIYANGKRMYLGRYATEAEARIAYLSAKAIHHPVERLFIC